MENGLAICGMLRGKNKDSFTQLLSAMLGIVSVIVPVLLHPEVKQVTHPLYPSVLTGLGMIVGGQSRLAIIFLIVCGGILGILNPERSWRWGVWMIIPFFLFTLLDLVTSMANHQLVPFEFIFYALLAIPGIIGATIGGYLCDSFLINKKS